MDFAQWDPAGGALQAWWLGGGGNAGARCETNDGFVHPAFPGGAPEKVQPSGAPVNPCDLQIPRRTGTATCQRTTGT